MSVEYFEKLDNYLKNRQFSHTAFYLIVNSTFSFFFLHFLLWLWLWKSERFAWFVLIQVKVQEQQLKRETNSTRHAHTEQISG